MLKRICLLPYLICLGLTGFAQATDEVRPLEPGRLMEREIASGQRHLYRITLTAGHFMRAGVEPRGVNVTLTLSAPDGNQVATADFAKFAGSESLSWEAAATGDYRLVVSALTAAPSAGAYLARIEVKATAAERDRRQISIERLLAEASQPNSPGAAASQRMIELAQQALALCREAGDEAREAYALFLIGSASYNQNRYDKAAEFFEPSLVIFRKLKYRGDEGLLLSFVGDSYSRMNQPEKAIDLLEQALRTIREVKDQVGEGSTLRMLVRAYAALRRQEKVIEYGAQALIATRELKDRVGEGNILRSLAGAYVALGRQDKAVEYGEQALSIAREVNDRRLEMTSLNSLGSSAYYLGDFEKARDYFEQALAVAREVKSRVDEGGFLLNLGNIYSVLSRLEKSIEYFELSLAIQRETNRRREQALALTCLGNAYKSVSDFDKAITYLEQSLVIYREFKDRSNEGLTLISMGELNTRIERYDKAIELLEPALTIMREIKDRRGEGAAMNTLGYVYTSLKRFEKAIEIMEQSVAISREVKDKANEGVYLYTLAETSVEMGRHDKAVEYYQQSLAIRRELKQQEFEAVVLARLARAELKRGNPGLARTLSEESLKITESLRSDIFNQDLRSSFFANAQYSYEFHVDLLMQMRKANPGQGYDALAVEASERARARGMLELLSEAGVDIRQGVDKAILEKERTLAQRLNDKAQQRVQSNKAPEQAAALNQEISALENEYQQVQAAIRRNSPLYAALTQPQPLKLREIQEQLDEETALLEYALGEERSFLWAITRNSLASYELPRRKEVEQMARDVYRLLTARSRSLKSETPSQRRARVATADAQLSEAARRLSRTLLAPVAGELGKKRLVIVADGALQYLPFAMLPEPERESGRTVERNSGSDKETVGQGDRRTKAIRNPQSAIRNPQSAAPLIVNHEVVSLPSASTLAIQRRELAGRRTAPKTVAVIADPVFAPDDERVRLLATGASQADAAPARVGNTRIIEHLAEASAAGTARKLVIPRLPFTRREADQILAIASGSETLRALDFKANRAVVSDSELSRYRYIHFATHGLLDSERPGLSALALSLVDEQGKPQDGFLRAHEVYNLNLPAELVVLSACQTGLGKEIKGEGLVGLTRGFMYAGAARVVVSLWNVNDKSTSELMAKFYQKMIKEGQRPAAALRSAQVEMWRQRQWQSPYYWAAFTLQGEWR